EGASRRSGETPVFAFAVAVAFALLASSLQGSAAVLAVALLLSSPKGICFYLCLIHYSLLTASPKRPHLALLRRTDNRPVGNWRYVIQNQPLARLLHLNP